MIVLHNKPSVPPAPGLPLGRPSSKIEGLLRALDPAILTPVVVPDPDAGVAEIVIADSLEPLPRAHDGLALLVGSSAADPGLADALHDAKERGYVAAVVKRRGAALPAVARAVDAAGIAVIVADDATGWARIEALLSAAVTDGRLAAGDPIGSHVTPDLYDLADALAARAEAAVTVEDVTGRVLAYSNGSGRRLDADRVNTILGRSVPDLPENAAEYRLLARSAGPVTFPAHDDTLSRVVMPVRAGNQLIGYIWAIDETGADGQRIGRELAVVAPQVAMHLLRAIRRSDSERQHLSERLAAAIGADGAAAGYAWDRLPSALVGFGPLDNTDNVVDDYRLTKLITLNAEAVCPGTLCARVDDTIFALLPDVDASGTGWLERVTASTMRLISGTPGVAVGCAFATPVRTREEIPRARADIDTMLRRLAKRRDVVPRDVVRDRHLVIAQQLSESNVAVDTRLVPQVAALLEHDRAHGSQFARTLLAHLDSFGDVRRAAAALSVHENSHRYRMHTMTERLGIDLTDPELRLITWLQLRETASSAGSPAGD